MDCRTAIIPHTANPAEHGDQITNDVVCHAGVWRNGGSGEDTHLCDDCIRIGLRVIKLKVDEMLGAVESDADKDTELAALTQRLGLMQHSHQLLAYAHDRMQLRLSRLIKVIDAQGIDETEDIRFARWESTRGPAIQKEDEYLFVAPGTDRANVQSEPRSQQNNT